MFSYVIYSCDNKAEFSVSINQVLSNTILQKSIYNDEKHFIHNIYYY